MWIVAGLFLGAWLASIVGQWFGLWWGFDGVLAGAVLGALAGAALQRLIGRRAPGSDRLAQLEARVGSLESEVARLCAGVAAAAPAQASHAVEPTPQAVTDAPSVPPTQITPDVEIPPVEPARVPRRGADVLAARRGQPALARDASAEPSTLDALYERARAWLLGGNTVVRVGLLVLFFGLAFLARYAVENSLLPIELRLSGIALGAIVLLGLGWRLRRQRSGYALSLQGGGVAVLYLTIFAAMRLYQMIPPTMGFVLLLAVVVFSTALAVWQNAQALAIIGTAGGFMAPILASTGEGSHVMLFSYYLLLNAGVLAVAWHKAWRGLNLVGFLFTFSIALAWGARDYRPELFASTEPFLIAFVLMYIAAAVLFAWRRAPVLKDTVDGTLVFGTPVVGFGLQAALVESMPYGLAWSALAAGGVYIMLARALHARARPTLRLLVESFLALGVAFLTLTIPLAVDGQWTAAAWAMEGAALLWVGTRQSRKLAIAAGLGLQLAAAGFFLVASMASGERVWPVLNGLYLGALLVSLAGFVSSRLADRARAVWPSVLDIGTTALLLWAVMWWLGGGLAEISAWFVRRDAIAATLAFFAISGALASVLARRLGWPALHMPALLAVPGMGVTLLMCANSGMQPAAGWGAPAWALALASALFALRRAEADEKYTGVLAGMHTALLWLFTGAVAWAVTDGVDDAVAGSAWAMASVLAVASLAVLGVLWFAARGRWPVVEPWRHAWVHTGAGGVVAAGVLCALAMSFASGGDVAPLPYLPLLNPLDLSMLLLLFVAWRWWQALGATVAASTPHLLKGLATVAFVLANGMLLRAVHHLAEVPWSDGALFASDTAQTSLSLFWGVLGLALTFFGSRRHQRTLWMVGAALLGVVVAKLFLVDMASTGTVARIVSFLGAGVLLLVVGYFSPLPPAREAAA